jgi:hypothetical protein
MRSLWNTILEHLSLVLPLQLVDPSFAGEVVMHVEAHIKWGDIVLGQT